MSSNFSNSGIHVAAYFGMVNPIKQLINNGADVNYRNKDGNTPLIATILGEGSKYQKREILDYLFKSGADVNIVNQHGDTALHVAVRAVNACAISSKFIQHLLDHGADKSVKNRSKLTPSQLAFQLGNTKLGDALLCHGGLGSISFKNKSNLGALVKDMFSCVFPVFAFRLQLRKDLEKMNLQLPSRNTIRVKKKIEISAPIAPPVIAQPYGGCTVLNQLPKQPNVNVNSHAQRNHMAPPQCPSNQNLIHYEKHNERVDHHQQQQWQPQHQLPVQATYGNVYTVDTPVGLPIEDKLRKQLNILQPPPY